MKSSGTPFEPLTVAPGQPPAEPVLESGAPVPPVAHVQADRFCLHCGHNLLGQPVWRDPRLGMLLCRCPDCGTYAAPSEHSAGGQPWLARLTRGAMLVWVLALVAGLALFTWAMASLMFADLGIFTARVPGIAGRIAVYVFPPTSVARQDAALVVAGCVATGVAFGLGVAVFFWQVRPRWYALAMLWPLVVAAAVFWFWRIEALDRAMQAWAFWRLTWLGLLQAGAVGLGALFGRPITRAVLRRLFPLQTLYLVDFLWHVDDAPLPTRHG